MEARNEERTVIAKPIASRPSCLTFKSFSELLAGAIDTCPPTTSSETTIPIRPKTVRLQPSVAHARVGIVSSQGVQSGTTVPYSSAKVLKPDPCPPVVYKPSAKLVSRTAASLLANLGNIGTSHQTAQVEVPAQVKHDTHTRLSSNLQHKFPSYAEAKKNNDATISTQNLEASQRALLPTASGDRPSYDGYNWRKYGQKQVKGSEYPRSYYKCTHPNCLVKKKVERSHDGQIAEIVYKGEHNHPKPQPLKRPSSGVQGQALVSDVTDRDSGNPPWGSSIIEGNEGSYGRIESQAKLEFSVNTNNSGKLVFNRDPNMGMGFYSGGETPDNSCGISVDCMEGSKGVDGNDDELNFKRRKTENQANEVGETLGGVREPKIVVQTSTEIEILEDGFRWRKYGQKVVRGNPHPRSYYRCTGLKCNVRKHVERASDDPTVFITTYEGKHNHEMPVSRSQNPVASDPGSLPGSKTKP